MRVNWKKEWTTPAAVGVVSFAAGAGTGILGYRYRLNRQIDRDLEAMDQLAKIGTITKVDDTDEGITVEGFMTKEFQKKLFEDYGKHASFIKTEDPYAGETQPSHAHGLAVDIPSADQLGFIIDKGEEADLPDSGSEPETEEAVEDPQFLPNPVLEDEDWSPPVVTNVFDSSWDEEAEAAKREDGKAYIIHQDQFFGGESGYRQSTLEFYEGDQILSDENNTPVYDGANIADAINFGHGSQDPNTCYIRNDEDKGDYEIVRNTGFYQIEVVGLHAEEVAQEDELRHSNSIRRFKMD